MSLETRFFDVVPHTAESLAIAIGATLNGNPQATVSGAAPFAEVQDGDLTFLADKAGAGDTPADAQAEMAAIVITTAALGDRLTGFAARLIVDRPRLGFAHAMTCLVPDTSPGMVTPADQNQDRFKGQDRSKGVVIGPGVMCGTSVKIGAGSRIDAGAIIHNGVEIGHNCHIGANSVLSHCTLGDDVTIQPNAVIGSAGFGFEITDDGPVQLPHVGSVIIGNGVLIGAGCCIDRGTMGPTCIGDQAMLDNLVHVAHNCVIGERAILTAQIGLAGGALIGAGAMMGGQAGVGPATRVGKGAVVMAQSGVTKDIEDGATVAGFPASDVRKMWRERAAIRRLLAQSERPAKKPSEIKPSEIKDD